MLKNANDIFIFPIVSELLDCGNNTSLFVRAASKKVIEMFAKRAKKVATDYEKDLRNVPCF